MGLHHQRDSHNRQRHHAGKAVTRIIALLLMSLANAGAQVFGSGSVATMNVLGCGDSIFVPLLSQVPVPGYVAQYITGTLPRPQFCAYSCYGVNGASFTNGYNGSTVTINQAAVTNIINMRRVGMINWAIIEGGSNGMALSNAPANQEFAGLTNLIVSLLTAVPPIPASNIVYVTPWPRQGNNDLPTFETNRQSFISNYCLTLSNMWPGIFVYNMYTNLLCGTNGCQSNTVVMNADRTHPTDAGDADVGLGVAKLIGYIN